MFKKKLFRKKEAVQEIPFFSRAPTHDSFIFNLQSLYELTHTRFVSLKLCVGFAIFDSVSFLLKFIFLFKNTWALWF